MVGRRLLSSSTQNNSSTIKKFQKIKFEKLKFKNARALDDVSNKLPRRNLLGGCIFLLLADCVHGLKDTGTIAGCTDYDKLNEILSNEDNVGEAVSKLYNLCAPTFEGEVFGKKLANHGATICGQVNFKNVDVPSTLDCLAKKALRVVNDNADECTKIIDEPQAPKFWNKAIDECDDKLYGDQNDVEIDGNVEINDEGSSDDPYNFEFNVEERRDENNR